LAVILTALLSVLLTLRLLGKKKKRKDPNVEQILSALEDASAYGTGFLAVQRVDPLSVFVRSPHDRGNQKKAGEF